MWLKRIRANRQRIKEFKRDQNHLRVMASEMCINQCRPRPGVGEGGGGGGSSIPIYPNIKVPKYPKTFPNIPKIERNLVYSIYQIRCKQNKLYTEYRDFSMVR